LAVTYRGGTNQGAELAEISRYGHVSVDVMGHTM